MYVYGTVNVFKRTGNTDLFFGRREHVRLAERQVRRQVLILHLINKLK